MELATGPPKQEQNSTAQTQQFAKTIPYTFEFTTKSLGLALQPIPSLQQEQHTREGGAFGFRVQVEQIVAGGAAEQSGKVTAGEMSKMVFNFSCLCFSR